MKFQTNVPGVTLESMINLFTTKDFWIENVSTYLSYVSMLCFIIICLILILYSMLQFQDTLTAHTRKYGT